MLTPQQILLQYFGHQSFRPLQLDIIEHVLLKKDTLAILPTGAGKSICYQVPALLLEGLCIVVTPLIALMKDQVETLQNKNIDALAVYSGLTHREISLIYESVNSHKTKFLFVSPERLKSNLFLDYLQDWKVGLLVIDEAHCISQWGYDFRPAYLEINTIRELIPKVPILALTASATADVQKDIIQKLQFDNHGLFFSTFIRKNLSYSSFLVENKIVKTIDILQKTKGSSLVYCKTRKSTHFVCEALQSAGLHADYYHAGLSQQHRGEKQDAWFENNINIIVCTNAFGMGIDKPDVRTVIHYDIPDCLEAYYQEAGRAGRDGQKAYAILLYQQKDIDDLTHAIDLKYPSVDTIKSIYQDINYFLQIPIHGGIDITYEFDIIAFCKAFKHHAVLATSVIKLLEQQGFWQLTDSVTLPSRLQILVDEKDVFDLEKYDKTAFEIIQQTIRMYGGAWTHFISIRENQLAKKLNISIEIITATLHKLHQQEIIDYIPSTEKPQLLYLHQRTSLPYLSIDIALIHWLKQRYMDSIENIIHYATDDTICKQTLIAKYFGEVNTATCGICNTCLKLQKVYTQADFDAIKNNILKELSLHNTLSIQMYSNQYSTLQREYVLKIIRFLLDEKIIKMNSFGELVKI